MATLSTQNITTAGVAPTYSAGSSGGDRFLAADRTFLHFKNTSGGAITVTLVTPGTTDTLALADRTVSVPATTGDRMVAVPDSLYRSSDGLADITYSANPPTGLTVAVLTV